jgi:hypothetical protein
MVILQSPTPHGRERCCHYVGFGGILGISEALDYHVHIRGAHRSRNGVATAATLIPPGKWRLAATREEGVLATAKLAGGYAVAERQSARAAKPSELQARRPVHHVRVEAITGAPIQGWPQPAAGCA